MTTEDTSPRTAGGRQIAYGVALLVAGALLALVLVQTGASTFSAAGYVLVAAGAALIGNGVLLRRKAATSRR